MKYKDNVGLCTGDEVSKLRLFRFTRYVYKEAWNCCIISLHPKQGNNKHLPLCFTVAFTF